MFSQKFCNWGSIKELKSDIFSTRALDKVIGAHARARLSRSQLITTLR